MGRAFCWLSLTLLAAAAPAFAQAPDVGMVGRGSHLGGGDAAGAVQGGEDLAQRDHLAAHAGFALHQRHLEALVGEVNRGLQAGDAAANH